MSLAQSGEFPNRSSIAGIQLSVVASFLVLWSGPNSSLPLVAFVLILLGSILVAVDIVG